MATTKTVRATDLNLYVLSKVFASGVDSTPAFEVPNRIHATQRPHIKRCVQAGLVEVSGAVLRLTDARQETLRAWREKEAAREAKFCSENVPVMIGGPRGGPVFRCNEPRPCPYHETGKR